MTNTGKLTVLVFIATLTCLPGCSKHKPAFDPLPDSHIIIVGNAFAERMYLYGWFEAALHAAFPQHKLVVRNMGWSGDTPGLQPRALNFGTMEEHLAEQEADIIFAAFGMNESFNGKNGLDAFRTELSDWATGMKNRQFNGVSAPQIILISPIAHEDLGPPLPDGRAHNEDLQDYTQVMEEVADKHQLVFIDLFKPSLDKMNDSERPLTINGIHLNDYGYWWASREIAGQLGLPAEVREAAGKTAPAVAALRQAIWDKNWHFFMRWRPVNMEYIRGRRREPFGVENFPREFETLDEIVAERDQRIWSMPKPALNQLWQSAPMGPAPWKTLPRHGG